MGLYGGGSLRSVVSAARAASNILIFHLKHIAAHTKSSSALASLAIGTEIGHVARIDTGSSKISFTKYWADYQIAKLKKRKK